MSAVEQRPAYDWEHARIGDVAGAVTVEITADAVRQFNTTQQQAAGLPIEPDDPDLLAVPPVMVRVFAPLRRRELVAENGAEYPNHPTPAIRWSCRFFNEPKVGDHIVSVTRVQDKYIRKDRHFLEWRVDANRNDGTPVAEFTYVNLWDRGRAEDRNR